MTIHKPQQVFQFTSKVPEGDRHDAQFADHAKAITDTQDALSDIRRSDGQLKNHIVTHDALAPGLIDQITQAYRQSIQYDAQTAQGASMSAVQSRLDAQNHAQQALNAAQTAVSAAQQVTGGAGTALAAVQTALQSAQALQTSLDQRAVTVQNAENDAALAAATAQDWADVSYAWAEHMPGTIPPNILAIMGITGDHWSSRWWANYCAQLVSGVQPAVDALYDFNEHYIGDSAAPPTLDGNGNPVTPGCMYFNTLDLTMYVWNGTDWQALTGSGGGSGTITGGVSLGNANDIYAGELLGVLQFKSIRFTTNFTVTTTSDEVQVALAGVTWGQISGTPTTLSGYGIADAYTKGEIDTKNNSQDAAINAKADTSAVNSALALKADKTYVDTQDAALQTAINGKANTNHTHTFTGGLTDTPANYTGSGGKLVAVKSDATGLEFVSPPAGDVTKAYVDQQDAALQTQITNNATAISGKYDKTGGPLNGPSSAKRTSAGTVTGTYSPNFAASDDHEATIASSVTIGAPTSPVAGQSGVIYITINTGAAISFASAWDWEGGVVPTPSTANGAVDAIAYHVRSPASIVAKYLKAVA